MRWSTIFTLLVSLFLLGGLAAPASGPSQRDVIANLEARQNTESATTTESAASEVPTTTTRKDASTTATDASTTAQATTTGTRASTTTSSMNATTTGTAATATSTVPSLDGATASSQQQAADSTRPTYSGGLPIQPNITPAFGVGGVILVALGALLAFIGVRKQWYGMEICCSRAKFHTLTSNRVAIFLSTGFLTALGVTVSSDYTENQQSWRLTTIVSIGPNHLRHEPARQQCGTRRLSSCCLLYWSRLRWSISRVPRNLRRSRVSSGRILPEHVVPRIEIRRTAYRKRPQSWNDHCIHCWILLLVVQPLHTTLRADRLHVLLWCDSIGSWN
jgi:hypothetical protein